MKQERNGYNFSRQWWDFAATTSAYISPIHTALYLWIVELNNRLGWMPKIGLPTEHTMHQIHVKSYRSYKKALNDLVSWGLIELRNKSHNQYTCNEVALVLKTKAKTKAKAKAEPAYINSKNINKPNGLKPGFLNDDAR